MATSQSSDHPTPPRPTPVAEFRPYRRFITWVVLAVCGVGGTYLYVSMGVTIWQRRHVGPPSPPVSLAATREELEGCRAQLEDVLQGLEKHLESFHHLFDHYDSQMAQDWADEGAHWRNQWLAAGSRCRLPEALGGAQGKDFEGLASVYVELGEIETLYNKELKRFGSEQAPRLDRARKRLDKIGLRIQKQP